MQRYYFFVFVDGAHEESHLTLRSPQNALAAIRKKRRKAKLMAQIPFHEELIEEVRRNSVSDGAFQIATVNKDRMTRLIATSFALGRLSITKSQVSIADLPPPQATVPPSSKAAEMIQALNDLDERAGKKGMPTAQMAQLLSDMFSEGRAYEREQLVSAN